MFFCRLDFWLTSTHLFDHINSVDICPAIKTDCSVITIEFKLIEEQRQAIITLINIKDKDRTLLGNWRPISLLNMDVKLLSKTLAYRIKKNLPKIIHSNQSGYVKGRFIE